MAPALCVSFMDAVERQNTERQKRWQVGPPNLMIVSYSSGPRTRKSVKVHMQWSIEVGHLFARILRLSPG